MIGDRLLFHSVGRVVASHEGYRLAERVARFVIVLSLSLSLYSYLPSPPLLRGWKKGKHGTRSTLD